MTLATICTNIAQDLGIDEPVTPIFGSKLPAAKRLVAQARRALWAIVRRADWAPLVIEYEFTADGASDYVLPPDFLSVVNDTVWERTRYWAMRGALSPQQWQRYRSSIYGRATIWRRWRIRVPSGEGAGYGTRFSIDPQVAATDQTSQFVFEYRSAWAVRHADGTMGPDWTGDDDTAILSEFLIELGTRWRMLRRLGLAYDEEKEEYDREVDKAVARTGGMMTLNLVPFYREDFIGQYSLGAFPPSPPPPEAPLPVDVARVIAPMERPDWQPPPDLGRPPPLPPRPALLRAPGDAERARVLLSRAPPPLEVPRPPPRRLRRRHQVTRPAPLAAPAPVLGESARPSQIGVPYPVAAAAPPRLPAPETSRSWPDGGAGGPLAPPAPEPQLPPGT
ncbi:MAG TPA: hypothetical protein VGF39_03900 [Stellaceae bacterium]|jgi:hypothetical protein